MDKQTQDIHQQMLSRELASLKMSIENIQEDITPPRATMPEVVFVDYFLNHFRSLASGMPVDENLTAAWVNIAGSHYHEVDIVDNAGNVIYSVPPLFAKPVVNKQIQQLSFNEINGRYRAEMNRLEIAGERFIHSALNGLETFVEPENKNEIVFRWQNIFKRYTQPQQPVQQEEVKNTFNQLEDNLEFEYE